MIYSFALLCMGATMLMAQADYKMWRTVSFEPKIDQVATFEKNLAAHNKKYHNEGSKKASVWFNLTGSNAGKYVIAKGENIQDRSGACYHASQTDRTASGYNFD